MLSGWSRNPTKHREFSFNSRPSRRQSLEQGLDHLALVPPTIHGRHLLEIGDQRVRIWTVGPGVFAYAELGTLDSTASVGRRVLVCDDLCLTTGGLGILSATPTTGTIAFPPGRPLEAVTFTTATASASVLEHAISGAMAFFGTRAGMPPIRFFPVGCVNIVVPDPHARCFDVASAMLRDVDLTMPTAAIPLVMAFIRQAGGGSVRIRTGADHVLLDANDRCVGWRMTPAAQDRRGMYGLQCDAFAFTVSASALRGAAIEAARDDTHLRVMLPPAGETSMYLSDIDEEWSIPLVIGVTHRARASAISFTICPVDLLTCLSGVRTERPELRIALPDSESPRVLLRSIDAYAVEGIDVRATRIVSASPDESETAGATGWVS